MAYLALYREWRPQTFQDIAGQEHVTKTLRNALAADRTGHAYLFCGSRGTGKTTAAKVLAKALNCLDRQGPEPCNSCANCLALNEGLAVDVIEIDAASNRGIDEIRDLREKVNFSPAAGRFRIYIVDEVHMLTNEAFNALLKTLEEPPRHVVFILATTEPQKVPLTILSRCQRFDFKRIDSGAMNDRLLEVAAGTGIIVDEDALVIITRAAEGSLRDALSILDQAASLGEMRVTAEDVHSILGTVRADVLSRMAGYLAGSEAGQALLLIGELTGFGKDLRLFAKELSAFLRALALEKIAPEGAWGNHWGDALRQVRGAADFSPEGLLRAAEILLKAEQEMKWGSLPGIILELALVKICRPELTHDLTALTARVAALEGKMAEARDSDGQHDLLKKEGAVSPTRQTAPRMADVPGVAGVPEYAADGGHAGRETDVVSPSAPYKASAPLMREAAAAGPAADEPGPELERVRSAWADIVNALRRARPSLYPGFIRAVPLHVRERDLTVGFPEGDELALGLADRPANKQIFAELLGKFLDGDWHVHYKYYSGDIPIPVRRPDPVNDIGRRFGGEEVTPEDETEIAFLFEDE